MLDTYVPTKVKFVVIEGHTLGYVGQDSPDSASILHASLIRRKLQGKAKGASPYNPHGGPISIVGKDVKMASKQDFDDFNVSYLGYEKDTVYNYIFAQDPAVEEVYNPLVW